MILLVGLGNPGAEYAKHRHNVGFMAIDAIADDHRFSPFRRKFDGALADGALGADGGSTKALLLKPLTYMNESGRAVAAAMRFYKLSPADIFVFHDELDLGAGTVRVKIGGGNAGHNGLKSITAHIGAEFNRIRIGIGHPGDRARVTGHVLGDFAKADAHWLNDLLSALASAAPKLTESGQAYGQAVGQIIKPQPVKNSAAKKQQKPPAPTEPQSRGEKSAEPSKDNNQFTEALKKMLTKN